MQIRTGLIAAVSFLGLLGAANAQTAMPANTGTALNGTYRVVSSQKVNAMYTSYNGQTAQCPNRRPGPLHIAAGHVHYTTATGVRLAGMLGPQGELTMRSEMLSGSRPTHLEASGAVEPNGTAHVRQTGSSCSYDFVWHK
jgi:hypothetical protein